MILMVRKFGQLALLTKKDLSIFVLFFGLELNYRPPTQIRNGKGNKTDQLLVWERFLRSANP